MKMTFILVLAYYLVSPGETNNDVHLQVYPKFYSDIKECEFMKNIVADEARKAYPLGSVAKCLGVSN